MAIHGSSWKEDWGCDNSYYLEKEIKELKRENDELKRKVVKTHKFYRYVLENYEEIMSLSIKEIADRFGGEEFTILLEIKGLV